MAEQERLENSKEQAHLPLRAGILMAVLAFLLGIGASSAWQFFGGGKSEEATFGGVAALLAPAAKRNQPASTVELREFVVNIVSEYEPHYARFSLALALDQASTQEEVNKRMAQIRDRVLLLVTSKTFEELQDQQGKLQVKAELKSTVNGLLTSGQVNEVYLTDFVVQ